MARQKERACQVVTYCLRTQSLGRAVAAGEHRRAPEAVSSHEDVTRARMAERIAQLLGCEFAGEYDRSVAYDTLYFVPAQTLLWEDARLLGIRDESHLFGGVVTAPVATTKSIAHSLFDDSATAPAGWAPGFAQQVSPVVLQGYSVFCLSDARRAAAHLLRTQTVRVKPALGIGGSGQCVVETLAELDAAFAAFDADELAHYGVVLEQNLDDAVTFSVGTVRIGGLQIAYYGEQQLTPNHQGENVYGGSTLNVVRGGLSALTALDLPLDIAAAVAQAASFDAAADQQLPGFIASRRNYDIVRGRDRDGRDCAGVLEQSWRIGGASPAEITALEAFAVDPQLTRIRTSSCESYSTAEPPAGARVHFRGIDPRVGAIMKYCLIHERG